jgi:hypothetical protein
MDVALGAAFIVNGVPSNDVCAPGALINVISIDDLPGMVTVWILAVTRSELIYEQKEVAIPELGTGPTFATQVPEMKLVPTIVIVLPL